MMPCHNSAFSDKFTLQFQTNKHHFSSRPGVISTFLLSHRRWHIVWHGWKPWIGCVPCGRKARGRGPPPLSLDTLTHTRLMPFSLNWGRFHIKSPPPITPRSLQFTLGANKEQGEEEEEEEAEKLSWSWPKNNSSWTFSMSQRHKATLSNIYQKAVPDLCA